MAELDDLPADVQRNVQIMDYDRNPVAWAFVRPYFLSLASRVKELERENAELRDRKIQRCYEYNALLVDLVRKQEKIEEHHARAERAESALTELQKKFEHEKDARRKMIDVAHRELMLRQGAEAQLAALRKKHPEG